METEVYISSDHAGFKLKQIIGSFLDEQGFKVKDLGPYEHIPTDDYPDYARKLCEKVLETNGRGILICGTGQGMSITANKFSRIRAALVYNEFTAEMAGKHIKANIICLGERTTKPDDAKQMVKTWLETNSSTEEKHIRRIGKIKEIENENMKNL